MSLLQFPDGTNSQNLQIWDNAAYDNASGGADGVAAKASCFPLRPIATNRSELMDFDWSKENRSPGSPVAKKRSLVPIKPRQEFSVEGTKALDGDVDDKSIDAEVEEIEREIGRLSERLEVLRVKKAERELRLAAGSRRGRIVPAKFLDPKQSSAKNLGTPASKNVQEHPASAKSQRRGFSLGPVEITAGIALTPIPLVQSRRKSCHWKLGDIEEEEVSRGKISSSTMTPVSRPRRGMVTKKVVESPAPTRDLRHRQRGVSLGPAEIASARRSLRPIKPQEAKEKVVKKEKGRSSSASPKPRRSSIAKVSELRKGIATVGAKKPVKREDVSLASIKPKTLFQEDRNQVSSKKQSKNAKFRVVASRYSLANSRANGDEPGSKRRKWSLLETSKEETVEAANKRSLSLGESQATALLNSKNAVTETTMRSETSHPSSFENSSPSIQRFAELLPKIRTIRCMTESPRDSGCAKRVADLVGRKSHFGLTGDEAATSPCQILTFEEEEE